VIVPGTARGEVAVGRVLARACAAEWLRLWTVRATWWFLAAASVAMVGLGLIAGFDSAAEVPEGDPAWVVPSVAAMPSQFALLALALTAVTADYASGGIVPALQWTPRRGVLFLARTVVAVAVATAVGTLLAVASAGAAYAAAQPVLELPVDDGLDVLGTVAGVFAAGAALAVGLGFLLRSTAGALVTSFLLMLVLPLFLPQFGYAWTSAAAELLPGSGAAFLLLGEVPGMTTAWSVAVLVGWAAAALGAGWLRFVRDDGNR
jgi:ABC-2 type transport system permease protein